MNEARIRGWRLRAEELHAVAGNMKDPEARRGMLNAARAYERMADEAERSRRPAAAAVTEDS